MPYRVQGMCVQVEKDGKWEVEKCHETPEDAKKHLMALQANVSHKEVSRLMQNEVGYTLLSATEGQACANCRWFSQREGFATCHLVMNFPDEILPTGWCQRHEGKSEMKPIPPETEATHTEDKALSPEKDWLTQLKELFTDWLHHRQPDVYSSFKAHGEYWHGSWTNNLQDRDGEWVTAKAIRDYIWRVDKRLVPLPKLCVWHGGEKATIGQATQLMTVEHEGIVIVSAIGTFDDTPHAQRAKTFYNQSNQSHGMSHGYVTRSDFKRERAYHAFNAFELTILPPHRASNPYAVFE